MDRDNKQKQRLDQFVISLLFFLLLSLPAWGQQWEEISSPSGLHLWDLVFVDNSVGYAAGPNHVIKTEDGGYTWDHIPLSGMAEEKYGASISFINHQEVVVGRNDLGLWKTEDGGTTWKVWNDTITGISRRLHLDSSGSGWYLVEKQLWRTTRGEEWVLNSLELPPDFAGGRQLGRDWECCFSNNFRDMYWFDRDYGIVVGGYGEDRKQADLYDMGRMHTTYDGGKSWKEWEITRVLAAVLGGIIVGPNPEKIWIVGSGEQLYIGHAMSWNIMLPRGGPDYEKFRPTSSMSGGAPHLNWWFSTGFILDEQTGWIAGTRIMRTEDGGETWTVEYGPGDELNPEWILRMVRVDNRLIAVGWRGRILMREIGGSSTGISPASWGTLKREIADD